MHKFIDLWKVNDKKNKNVYINQKNKKKIGNTNWPRKKTSTQFWHGKLLLPDLYQLSWSTMSEWQCNVSIWERVNMKKKVMHEHLYMIKMSICFTKCVISELEAQWAELVSLTFYFVLRKLYTEPSINRCFLPNFGSFGYLVSEEKIF